MSWSLVTLVAPSDEIAVNGKVINIHKVDIIKINENGGLNFIEKQPSPISRNEADELAEQEKLWIKDDD